MRGPTRSASFWLASIGAVAAACSSPGRPYFSRTSPVEIIDRFPPAGAIGVSIDSQIEVDFGEGVDPVRITDTGVLGLFTGGGTPLNTRVTYDSTGRVAVMSLIPAGTVLNTNASYTVRLQGLIDAQGRAVQNTSWGFATGAPPLATSRVAYVPAQNAANVPLNWVVRLGFAAPLNPLTVTSSLAVSIGGAFLAGRLSYDALAQALLYVPQDGTLAQNQTVKVSLSNPAYVLRDVFNRPVTLPDWTFSVPNTANNFDGQQPTLGGPPSAVESPGGSGNVVVTLPVVPSDGFWSTPTIRYDVTVAHQSYVAVPTCNDPLDPSSTEVAWIGTGTVSLTGLANGNWSLVVQAENGSGIKSVPSTPVSFQVVGNGVRYSTSVTGTATLLGPLFSLRCALAGCHSGGNSPGYVDFTQPLNSWENQRSGEVFTLKEVTPFCLEQSYLWRKVQAGYSISGGLMPPVSVDVQGISRAQRAAIAAWIEQGAQN